MFPGPLKYFYSTLMGNKAYRRRAHFITSNSRGLSGCSALVMAALRQKHEHCIF